MVNVLNSAKRIDQMGHLSCDTGENTVHKTIGISVEINRRIQRKNLSGKWI